MAEQTRPLSPNQAPDPARSYERAKPEAEAGMGRMDSDKAVPSEHPDHMKDAISHAQGPRQINAHDVVSERATGTPGTPGTPEAMRPPEPVDHSMKEEEPDGWDLAPNDIKDPKAKRHPRTEGKGGTP
jgi:hypothetical protein